MRRLLVAVLLAALFPAAASAQSFLDRHPGAGVHLRAGRSTPSLVTNLAIALPPGDPDQAIRGFLIENADFLGFDPRLSALEAKRPMRAGRATVYRFDQTHLGLPVLGADVAVSLDAQGRIAMIGSSLERLGAMPLAFAAGPERALAVAVEAVQPRRWSGKPKSVRQAIAGVAGEWRPIWEVALVTLEPLASYRVWVDGASLRVLQHADQMLRAQGYAYPNCPEAGAYQSVPLDHLTSTTNVVGTFVDMYSDCNPFPPNQGGTCSSANRNAAPDVNGDYLILPNEGSATDGFAEVHTYYHLNQMHDWFKAANFSGLDFAMPIAVNYTENYQYACNAGYGEGSILVGLCDLSAYGGSGKVNFAYDSISVMHEYTHGAVDYSANFDNLSTDEWGLVAQQMALHEGYADFFPAVVLDDPKIGRHVSPKLGPLSGGSSEYMRILTDVRTCPNDLTGESHDDGQVWGSANWAAYVASGKDPKVALAVFQGLVGLSKRPTFADAAYASLAAAASDAPVKAALETAYVAHGLLGCGREIQVASGQTVKGGLPNLAMQGISTTPYQLQFKILVPQNATALNFTVKGKIMDSGQATSNVRVWVNLDQHVAYGTSVPGTWTGTSSINIPNPLPGAYYFLPVGSKMGWNSGYSFEVTATTVGGDSYDGGFPWYPDGSRPGPDAAAAGPDAAAPGPDAAAAGPDAGLPDAGPADAAAPGEDASATADAGPPPPEGSGCSCGVDGPAGLWSVLALAALALRRRRT